MQLQNVAVTESNTGRSLSWEHNGFRYHIWETGMFSSKNEICKRPLDNDTSSKIRWIDPNVKANAAMLAEASRIANEQGLYAKATQAVADKEAAEEAARAARVAKELKEQAAEQMYDALKWVVEKYHRTLAPYCHAHEWDTLLNAIAKAEAR